MTGPPNLAGGLEEGEEILWQGRPDGAVVFEGTFGSRFGAVVFLAFSTFWTVKAWEAPGIFRVFGAVFIGLALNDLAGKFLWRAFLRRRTIYTLTNRRALLEVDHPLNGKRLQSYPITDDMELSYDGREPGMITFEEAIRKGPSNWSLRPVSFQRVTGAKRVYTLFAQVKANAPQLR